MRPVLASQRGKHIDRDALWVGDASAHGAVIKEHVNPKLRCRTIGPLAHKGKAAISELRFRRCGRGPNETHIHACWVPLTGGARYTITN